MKGLVMAVSVTRSIAVQALLLAAGSALLTCSAETARESVISRKKNRGVFVAAVLIVYPEPTA
jgi:hypothetical protein